MTRSILPQKHHRAYRLIQILDAGPGTFYQVCERAGFDLDAKSAEGELREIFESLLRSGTAYKVGIIYSITDAARAALTGNVEAYVGQVAGPAPRGVPFIAPVRIVRRSAEAVHP
jgi:hypothetical protein